MQIIHQRTPDVLSFSATMELLGVSRTTLRRYVKEGRLIARNLGGDKSRIFFLRDELIEALRQSDTETNTAA